jgi:hypothetical protein
VSFVYIVHMIGPIYVTDFGVTPLGVKVYTYFQLAAQEMHVVHGGVSAAFHLLEGFDQRSI